MRPWPEIRTRFGNMLIGMLIALNSDGWPQWVRGLVVIMAVPYALYAIFYGG